MQGKDPAAVEAQRRGERFIVYRSIPIDRRHWVASMQGILHLQGIGSAYVHTDGSVTMLQSGKEIACKCGAFHSGV